MCQHPNIKLTITWAEQASTTGAEVDTYTIQPASLVVRVAGCPDCGLTGNSYSTCDGWEQRWPNWLLKRVSDLATFFPTIHRAARACLPGLVQDTVR